MTQRPLNYYRPVRQPDRHARGRASLAAGAVTVAAVAGGNLFIVLGARQVDVLFLLVFPLYAVANAALGAVLFAAPAFIERAAGTTVNLSRWLIVVACTAAVFVDPIFYSGGGMC